MKSYNLGAPAFSSTLVCCDLSVVFSFSLGGTDRPDPKAIELTWAVEDWPPLPSAEYPYDCLRPESRAPFAGARPPAHQHGGEE